MVEYFRLVSEELLIKLNQVRAFIKKHNPTIGLLTEEILRSFLKEYIQKGVSVEQGFILNKNGELSKQCDIIIYDSDLFAPFYRINDIVVVPHEAVISIIEIKTTVTKQIFHHVIDYFKSFAEIINYSKTNTHPGDYQEFDHDTFQYLPDTITGINSSFHLRKDYVVFESDMMGYTSYNYENEKNLEISSLELFYLKIYSDVEEYLNTKISNSEFTYSRKGYGEERKLKSIFAIELFHM